MNYGLLKEVLDLVEAFESEAAHSSAGIDDFKRWIVQNHKQQSSVIEPDWEGKQNGRSAESVISTLIVHMNRYAKSYSKSALLGSDFSTQEDFIYLINLKAFGEMTKMSLIKKNVHDKPAGMQIINRLIAQGWVVQKDSETDKRSKVVKISDKGLLALQNQMDNIRIATQVVSGDLTQPEKMELIRLLHKLSDFHRNIYDKNIGPEDLLARALKEKAQ